MENCEHITKGDLPDAVREEHDHCVNILMETGADVNNCDQFHMTPLMYAIGTGNIHMVNKVIEAGADVNHTVNKFGYNLIMLAARDGRSECLGALIKAGADVNKRDVENRSAIFEAIENNHNDCVDILLDADIECYSSEYIADIDEEILFRGLYPIHVAIQKDNLQCVKKLAEYTGGNEIRYDNRIHTASSSGITSLMLAAKHGSENCLQYLLDEGANVNAQCAEALTALMFAAEQGKTKCVELLLQGGADVKETDERGMTALMYAAKGGHAACLNLLLQAGADLTDSGDKNYTALEFAVEGNSLECVNLLLEAGADVNSDSLVLHLVVDRNTTESFKMLEMFVNAGVDISNTPVPLLPRAAGSDALEHMHHILCIGKNSSFRMDRTKKGFLA